MFTGKKTEDTVEECEITNVRVKLEDEDEDFEQGYCVETNYNHELVNYDHSVPVKKKRKRSKAPPGKPPYSYVALTTMAITSTPYRKMNLADILRFIQEKFPYYRTCPLKWKNAIRHNLTINDCFVKLPLENQQKQRSHFWTVDPTSEMTFDEGSYRRRKRRFTRNQEDLGEVLPLLVERTTSTPSYHHTPPLPPPSSSTSHFFQPISCYPIVPVITNYSANPPPRHSFLVQAILASAINSP